MIWIKIYFLWNLNRYTEIKRFSDLYINLSNFCDTVFVRFSEIPWFGRSFLHRFFENPWFGSSFLNGFPKIPYSEVLFWPIFRKSLVRKFIFERFSENLWFGSSFLTDFLKIPGSEVRFRPMYRLCRKIRKPAIFSVNRYLPVFRNSLIRKFNFDRCTVFKF